MLKAIAAPFGMCRFIPTGGVTTSKGNVSVEDIANMAKGRLRNKMELLKKSLNGLMGPHQKIMLKTQLDHIDFLERADPAFGLGDRGTHAPF